MGEDLILTAGHCADEIGDCTGRRFLFDFAVKSPDDPLGDQIPLEGGLVFIP